MRQRLMKSVWIFFSILLMSGSLMSCDFIPYAGYNDGYEPEQPIPFSHKKHAGEYGIKCLYCHATAEKASHSSVPSLNVCMNCHLVVATQSEHIAKLREAYTSGGSIEWKKVHLLPDHVKFNHSRHIAKGVSCNTCHGAIEKMEVVKQHSSLAMGWCINCHRQPEHQAPVNCTTCHY